MEAFSKLPVRVNVQNGLLAILFIASLGIGLNNHVDIRVFYWAARYAVEGRLDAIYGPEILAVSPGRFFYSPVALAFFYPLGLLPYRFVHLFWLALQSVAFFTVWKVLVEQVGWLKSPKFTVWWFLVWVFAVNPIHGSFQSGNVSLLLAALVFAAESLAQRESKQSQMVAGALVAVAAILKVFPAFIVLYYIFFKSHRVRLGILLAAVLSAALPLLLFGFERTVDLTRVFVATAGSYGDDNSFRISQDILCLPGLLARNVLFWLPELLARRLALGVSALVGAFFFIQCWFNRKALSKNPVGWWSLALALMVLLNPSSRPHYFVFYLPAFALLCAFAKERGGAIRGIVVVSLVLICLTVQSVVGKNWNDRLERFDFPTLGLILLVGTLWVWLTKTKPRHSRAIPLS